MTTRVANAVVATGPATSALAASSTIAHRSSMLPPAPPRSSGIATPNNAQLGQAGEHRPPAFGVTLLDLADRRGPARPRRRITGPVAHQGTRRKLFVCDGRYHPSDLRVLRPDVFWGLRPLALAFSCSPSVAAQPASSRLERVLIVPAIDRQVERHRSSTRGVPAVRRWEIHTQHAYRFKRGARNRSRPSDVCQRQLEGQLEPRF